MACIIHTNRHNDTVLSKLQKDLSKSIEIGNKKYGGGQLKTVYVYQLDESVESRPCNIPFFYGLRLAKTNADVRIERPERKELATMGKRFVGTLRDEQTVSRNQALTLLTQHKSCILSCYTGFGKTVTAINMASKIKLPTLIAVPKKPLLAQWEQEIAKFIPTATVVVVDPSKIKSLPPQPECDFCIINTCNLEKLVKHDPKFVKTFGFLIVDEAHLQMTETMAENLLHVTPRYLLGITATPYRDDGYHVLFDMFFGPEMVKIKLNKKHTVYKVKTGFCPDESRYKKKKTLFHLPSRKSIGTPYWRSRPPIRKGTGSSWTLLRASRRAPF
ncbi:hypothetical protein MIV109L [Invertebrate iridescent virus 3]|uniref:Putative helicase 109L n=1 Tax=Invertebrate iridescent virus 3 TaxID=345201 RepID=VF161_IIV3|nr:hypothetical protein MIV109L [Invertebrate iridescent virus 3]Q196V1.1 RecName: Full=Putative helicase 109L [Invertebrate iridescent virus 3]ABF82139.1 hypothetical protein MIV109L [Invertebrate iridescent virus 3]